MIAPSILHQIQLEGQVKTIIKLHTSPIEKVPLRECSAELRKNESLNFPVLRDSKVPILDINGAMRINLLCFGVVNPEVSEDGIPINYQKIPYVEMEKIFKLNQRESVETMQKKRSPWQWLAEDVCDVLPRQHSIWCSINPHYQCLMVYQSKVQSLPC